MSILNSLNQVWQNTLVLIVLFVVGLWLYKNMKNENMKSSINDFFENLKEEMKGGNK